MKPSEVRKAYTVADLIEVLESFEDDETRRVPSGSTTTTRT